MSTQTPKKKKSRIITIGTYTILGLIILAFILPSALSNIGSGGGLNANIFGKYGNTEIKFSEHSLLRQTAQNIDNYYAQYNPESKKSSFYNAQLYREAFDATVQIYALLDAAKQVNFKISETKLKDLIINSGYFKDQDGVFNKKYYDTLDAPTKNAYIETIEMRDIASAVQTNILDTAFISDNEIAFYQHLNNQKKAFSYIRLEKNKINNIQVVKDYALANQELFKSVHYKSITFDDKKQAQTTRDALLGVGETITFEEAVELYSKDTAKETGGDRGQSYVYQIKEQEGADTLQILLSLQNTDDISEVVETRSGNFALYQLTAETSAIDTNGIFDDDAIEIVQDYLATYEPGLVEEEGIKDADNFIAEAKNTSFSQSALFHSIEIGRIPLAPLNVDNISLLDTIESEEGVGIENLANTEDVLSEIYTLDYDNDISSPFVIGNYIYIFQLTDISNANEEANENTSANANKNTSANTSEEENNDVVFATRTRDFIKDNNQKQLKQAVIDDNKLTNNFVKAFDALFQ